MGPFVLRRLLTVVAIIPVITLLVFLMRVLVPGDPVEIMFMGQSADRATIERVRRELGWDRPLPSSTRSTSASSPAATSAGRSRTTGPSPRTCGSGTR